MKIPTVAALASILCAFGLFVWPGVFIYDHDGANELVRVNRFTGTKQYSTDNGWMTMKDLEIQARNRILTDVRRNAQRGIVSSAVWQGNVLSLRDPQGSENNAFFGLPADTAAVEATFQGTPAKLTEH